MCVSCTDFATFNLPPEITTPKQWFEFLENETRGILRNSITAFHVMRDCKSMTIGEASQCFEKLKSAHLHLLRANQKNKFLKGWIEKEMSKARWWMNVDDPTDSGNNLKCLLRSSGFESWF